MKLKLLTCDAQRPDRRAISKCLIDISSDIDTYTANDLTDILLDGDSISIEVDDKNTSSAYRALRKLDIEYDIVD